MKTVVEFKLQDSVLAQWRGADAKLWMYHVTHKRFALMLSRPNEPEVLYVVAVACEHIVGPFSWKHANITLVPGSSAELGEPICRVLDKQAGFELVCSSAALVRGPATELDESFENFLGEAPDTV
jgi:hypothetical protein